MVIITRGKNRSKFVEASESSTVSAISNLRWVKSWDSDSATIGADAKIDCADSSPVYSKLFSDAPSKETPKKD